MSEKENKFKPKELSEQEKRLVILYSEQGRTLDNLPYTKDFDCIHVQYEKEFGSIAKDELYKKLLRLRKSGRLPRITDYIDTMNQISKKINVVNSELGLENRTGELHNLIKLFLESNQKSSKEEG